MHHIHKKQGGVDNILLPYYSYSHILHECYYLDIQRRT